VFPNEKAGLFYEHRVIFESRHFRHENWRKIEYGYRYYFWKSADANYPKLSKLVRARRNYSYPKLARLW